MAVTGGAACPACDADRDESGRDTKRMGDRCNGADSESGDRIDDPSEGALIKMVSDEGGYEVVRRAGPHSIRTPWHQSTADR